MIPRQRHNNYPNIVSGGVHPGIESRHKLGECGVCSFIRIAPDCSHGDSVAPVTEIRLIRRRSLFPSTDLAVPAFARWTTQSSTSSLLQQLAVIWFCAKIEDRVEIGNFD